MATIKIQIGNANDTGRFNKSVKSKYWNTIVECDSPEKALSNLVQLINSEEIVIENSFLRIIDEKKVINL